MKIVEILESIQLLENVSKGGENVLRDKKLVARLAEQLRDDFSLPRAVQVQFKRATDEAVATWFIEQLDAMEKRGVGGVIYGRNGQFHFWVANNYANGTDIWEDIEGELPEALRDFTILKNRNMLDTAHDDVQKFKGVKSLHRYMVQHYEAKLNDIRKDAELASMIKSRRSIKLVDNEQYSIYFLQNRAAAIAFGKGATFCTANSRSDTNWNSYSNRAPIFGLVAKTAPVQNTTGRPELGPTIQEKYQFDASTSPRSANFRDYLDHQQRPEDIQEKFPYLWDDLSKGIMTNQAEIQTPEEEPGVEKKAYDVGAALEALKANLGKYFTNKKRPAEVAPEEPEVPQLPPAA